MAALKTINTPDKNIQLIQDNIAASFRPLTSAPMYGANIFDGVKLTAGVDNLIQHFLGRFPKRFFVGSITADSRVWSPTTTALSGVSSNATYINLWCSANCTISLWVN